jgi:hypothetical protein
MILPTKRLAPEKALITVGAEILRLLAEPKTVSRTWEEIRKSRKGRDGDRLTYDWFVLALDLLYALGALTLERGRLVRSQ